MIQAQPYLPFASLLALLERHGFELGPREHIRLQALLNTYAGRDFPSLDRFRDQMAAILCKSEAEQKRFRELWETHLSSYTYDPPKEQALVPARDWKRWLPWLLLPLLLAVVLGGWWFLFRAITCDELKAEISSHADSRQRQRLDFDLSMAPPAYQRSLPEVDSIVWDFGDGSPADTGSSPRHYYQKAGAYVVTAQVYSDACMTSHRDTQRVYANIRLQAAFRYQQQGNSRSYRFTDQSYYLRDSARGDTPISYRYQWTFGDGAVGAGRDTLHDYPSLRTYTARLIVTASWPDTTLSDTATQQVSTRPQIGLRRFSLIDEDISDLVRSQQGDKRWPALFLALLLAYLLFELIRAWLRKVVIEENPDRGPPIQHPLLLESPPLGFVQAKAFYQVARMLRRRRVGRDRMMPDIPASVSRTLEKGGMPMLEWKHASLSSQYLVLIEARSRDDHLARLYETVCRDLNARDITVACYFYHRTPEQCRTRVHGKVYQPLGRLMSQYAGYRLLIIGTGEDYVAAEGGLSAWCDNLEHWEERAFLSTKATEAWGMVEGWLAERMPLVPATQEGFVSLIEQWQREEAQSPLWWRRHQYEIAPPRADSPALVEGLHAYLGTEGFEWLCACAWYPELYWDLTLQMGNLLHGLHGEAINETPLPYSLDYLLHLLRLPCFREGKMSPELRTQLAAALPEEQAQGVRKHLLHLLAQEQNQPPPGSYAEADTRIRTALFSYLNSARNLRDRGALKEELQRFDADDIEDSLVLRELGKVQPGSLGLVLPARYFRGKLPLLGLKRRVRMALVSLPLLLLTLLSFFLTYQKAEEYDPKRSYSMLELHVQNNKDTARWLVHAGYQAYREDSLEEVSDAFHKAWGLDSTYLKALYNYHYAGLNELATLADQGEWEAARDSFSRIKPIRTPEGEYRKPEMSPVVAHYTYIASLISLQLHDTLTGVVDIPMVFCGEALLTDTLVRNRIRDSIAAIESYRQLLRIRAANAGGDTAKQRILRAAMACLGIHDTDTIEPNEAISNIAHAYRRIDTLRQVDSLRRLGDQYERAYKEPEAREVYRQLLRLQPMVQKWRELFEEYDGYVRIDSFLTLARRYERDKDLESALKAYQEVFRLQPGNESVLQEIMNLEERLGIRPEQQQKPARPDFQGRIYGADNQVLTGVRISGEVRDTLSGSNGRWGAFLSNPATATSVFRLRFEYAGYQPLDTSLRIGGTAIIRLKKKPTELLPPSVLFPEMVSVKGGTFWMGCGDNSLDGKECNDREKPLHQVSLSRYEIGQYEVTNEAYCAFLNAKGNQRGGGERTGMRKPPVG